MAEAINDLEGTRQLAFGILAAADDDDNFLEHHGIKGQRWGRRRTPAELGYRQAMRQKRKEEKLAARKEKYMRDPKQVYKHKSLFTQEEINRATARAQQEQRLYESSHARQIQRAKERQAARAERDAKRQVKAAERAQIKDEKRKERMHKLEEKTKLEMEKARGEAQVKLQEQRDKAQAEREQANREYQTQQQIKKGKTLTARLAKAGALLKNISVVAENGQKLAADMGITAHYDSKKSLLSGLFGKLNWSQDDKDAFNMGMSGQEYKDWKARNEAEQKQANQNKPKQSSDQNKPTQSTQSSASDQNKPTQPASDSSGSAQNAVESSKPKKRFRINRTERQKENNQPEPETTTERKKFRINKTSKKETQQEPEQVNKTERKKFRFNRKNLSSVSNNTENNETEITENNEIQKPTAEATARAKEIKENISKRQSSSSETLSDTAKYVQSLSVTKLASILSGVVPMDMTPDHINIGSQMKTPATKFEDAYVNNPKMLRKQRKGHKAEGRWSDDDNAGDECEC